MTEGLPEAQWELWVHRANMVGKSASSKASKVRREESMLVASREGQTETGEAEGLCFGFHCLRIDWKRVGFYKEIVWPSSIVAWVATPKVTSSVSASRQLH